MPKLIIVVAVAENGAIGLNGTLPWRLPEDLKRFRRLTTGHIVLMGRKTYESLGRPLPDRDNWVLTRDPNFAASGVQVFGSLQAALAAAETRSIMVIGGADLYAQALPLAETIELTRVHAQPPADTFFPALDAAQWQETFCQHHAADERHAHGYTFVTLQHCAAAQDDSANSEDRVAHG